MLGARRATSSLDHFLVERYTYTYLTSGRDLLRIADIARDQGKAIVLSLHDPNLARRFATHAVILFDDAKVRAGRTDQVIDAATLSEAYGHPVIEIVDGKSGDGGQRAFVPA